MSARVCVAARAGTCGGDGRVALAMATEEEEGEEEEGDRLRVVSWLELVVLLQGEGIGELHCAAVCCDMLHCVATWCSVLHWVRVGCVAARRRRWCVVVCYNVHRRVAVCQVGIVTARRRQRCVAVCCSVLQYFAVYCSMS